MSEPEVLLTHTQEELDLMLLNARHAGAARERDAIADMVRWLEDHYVCDPIEFDTGVGAERLAAIAGLISDPEKPADRADDSITDRLRARWKQGYKTALRDAKNAMINKAATHPNPDARAWADVFTQTLRDELSA